MAECLFCCVVKGTLPSYKIWEDKDALVFLDIFPVTPGHTLIVPKVHSENYLELTPEIFAHMGQLAQRIASAHLALGAEGSNLFVAQGVVAGQTVFHTHWHCVPRRTDDGVILGQAGVKATEQELVIWQEKLVAVLEVLP